MNTTTTPRASAGHQNGNGQISKRDVAKLEDDIRGLVIKAFGLSPHESGGQLEGPIRDLVEHIRTSTSRELTSPPENPREELYRELCDKMGGNAMAHILLFAVYKAGTQGGTETVELNYGDLEEEFIKIGLRTKRLFGLYQYRAKHPQMVFPANEKRGLFTFSIPHICEYLSTRLNSPAEKLSSEELHALLGRENAPVKTK